VRHDRYERRDVPDPQSVRGQGGPLVVVESELGNQSSDLDLNASYADRDPHVAEEVVKEATLVGNGGGEGVPDPEVGDAEREGGEEEPGPPPAPPGSGAVGERADERVVDGVEGSLDQLNEGDIRGREAGDLEEVGVEKEAADDGVDGLS